jgi:hypothetical protein
MAKKQKYLLIKYTNVDGEREYAGHSIILISPRKKEENAVHEFFKDFWGLDDEGNYVTNKDCEKCTSYSYFGGEVAVYRICWNEITEEQYQGLKELGL